MHLWVCFLGANFRHNSQGLLIREGKNSRLVWAGSTMYTPMDIVMHNMTPSGEDIKVTFGLVKILFYWLIYNQRACFPGKVIYLALADIKACFRFLRIHPDLAGTFGFMEKVCIVSQLLWCLVPTHQHHVGSLLCRGIKRLTKKYSNQLDLVETHKCFIDVVK